MGKLDRRGFHCVFTLTVKEYLEASRWKRFSYRLVRNPFVLFVIAPLYLFLIEYRFPTRQDSKKQRQGVHWTNLAIVAAILDDLDATFPQASANAATNAYIDSDVQNWGAHPYTLGAYSYAKIGTFTTASDNKRADLKVPVAGNRIYFAGEASHETHPSTVVGALHEGERAANEVHSANGNPNDPPPIPVPEPERALGVAVGTVVLWLLAAKYLRLLGVVIGQINEDAHIRIDMQRVQPIDNDHLDRSEVGVQLVDLVCEQVDARKDCLRPRAKRIQMLVEQIPIDLAEPNALDAVFLAPSLAILRTHGVVVVDVKDLYQPSLILQRSCHYVSELGLTGSRLAANGNDDLVRIDLVDLRDDLSPRPLVLLCDQ